MLDHLKRKLNIPDEKLPILMSHCGDRDGRLKKGQCLMLLGFGMGYSWAGSIVNW
jgi:3-oxoacyl-[acyl-carrier-protein] synthase III